MGMISFIISPQISFVFGSSCGNYAVLNLWKALI